MDQDGQRKPRKPLPANLAWATALIILLFSGYVLSYAPAYRYTYGPDGANPDFFFEPFRSAEQPMPLLFRPVEWLMDNSPLDRVLVRWAALWRVARDVRYDSNLRIGWQLEAHTGDSGKSTQDDTAP
jgi:hypothetical protein